MCIDDVVRIPGNQCKEDFALKEGDILYGLSGSIGETGSLGNYARVKRTDLPAQLNQRIARFQPRDNVILAPFLVYTLRTRSFYEQVIAQTSGTAQFNVSTTDIGRIAIALPSLDEQRQIVEQLLSFTKRVDVKVERTKRQIDLLREYRTQFVTEVVTGKVDVRGWAASFVASDLPFTGDQRGVTVDTDSVKDMREFDHSRVI